MDLALEKAFTRVYRAHAGAHIATREAACLRVLYPALLGPIEPGDLFAGRALMMEYRGVGFSPDVTLFSLPHGMGYFYRPEVFERALAEAQDDGERREIADLMAFWETENTTAHVKRHFTPRVREALPSDSFAGDVGVGFPLYRMTGAYENVAELLTLGLDGLDAKIAAAARTAQSAAFLDALADTVALLSECAYAYAGQASGRMAEDLLHIAHRPPRTLRQAIQLAWLYFCVAGVMDYGRMDVVFGDFLARDLADGTLTPDAAQEALCGLWRLMVARKTVYHGRVVLGGRGRPNEANADAFALLAMEASRIVHDIEPQLTLRLYRGMNPRLADKATEVIAAGTTYPMLYNDDVNIPSVAHAFCVDEALAEQYVPFGCGEYIIDHKSFGSPNGVINLLKALEVTLCNGRELIRGQAMGLSQGAFDQYADFDAFYAAYKRQLLHYIEALADAEKIILDETGRQAPFLMMSLLYDGCVEAGRSMLCGGLAMLGATLESYGNINAVDSLCAIRDVVFERRLIAPETLLAALRADFAGYERERALLLASPKYGNDDPRVDALARDLHDFEARAIREQAARVGLHSFLMVVINNSANTYLGRWTGASADGRRAGTYMANANNPVGGMDTKGMTAMLNSLLHFPPENHAGVVQNLKFSREVFRKAPEKLRALLGAYFADGGTQAMVTVVGRRDLENALADPDAYRNLVVRVGGFSARFVELEPDVQQEILSRTCY